MNRYMITNRYKSYIIPRIIKIIEKKMKGILWIVSIIIDRNSYDYLLIDAI